MSLVEFHRQVNEATAQRQKSLLSDRLKSKRSESTQQPQPQSHRPRTAATVAGAKEAVDLKDFPALGGYEAPELVLSGAWANGIQPILDAKDLPDPNSLAEQKRRKEQAARERKRYRSQQYYQEDRDRDRDAYDDDPIYDDDPVYDRAYDEDAYDDPHSMRESTESEPMRGYGMYADARTGSRETWDL